METNKLKTNEVKILISSTLENLALIRSLIRTYLGAYKIEERSVMEILTIVDELATNAVEHGYLYEPGEMTITVEKEESLIKLVVEDDGIGFDDTKVSKDEGGMGLKIAAKMSDSFLIERKVNGTKFKVEKKIREDKQ